MLIVACAASTMSAATVVVAAERAHSALADTTLVSVATDGGFGDGDSFGVATSADGRFVAFESSSENLVAGDSNSVTDVFVRDVVAGTTERVSVATDGTELDGDSYDPGLSADGRYVVFTSDSDLADELDENGLTDVFRHDRLTGVTQIMSVTSQEEPSEFGAWEGVISGNGQFVAFSTDYELVVADENFEVDVYIRDVAAGTTSRVSGSTNGGDLPALGYDGRYVAFSGPCGVQYCVWRRDRATQSNTKISVATNGANPNGVSFVPSMSADGDRVAFISSATDLAATTDGNGGYDVFVRTVSTATTTLVSAAATGGTADLESGGARISPDGSHVAFVTAATNLRPTPDASAVADVFLRDLDAGTVERITTDAAGGEADGHAITAAPADGGAAVVFSSAATDVLAAAPTVVPQAYRWTPEEPVVDATAPTVAMLRPGGRVTLTTTVPVAWEGSDTSGIDHFDVQRRTASWSGGFGAPTTHIADTDATSAPHPGTYGRTYCFSARATDTFANVSAYSPAKCTSIPLRSDHLTYTASWTAVSSPLSFGGSHRITSTAGAVAKRTQVVAERLYVVATKCAACGSIRVSWNGTPIKTISLQASTTQRQQVLPVVAFTSARSGTVTITALTSGRFVILEGLAVHQD
ncbi:MAG TPA: hypothetical protein VFZ83_15205 [Acidimicrobiia bacterium]|nr:hypothetical protein [Acidimicrobiia bacterium]